LFSSAKAPLSSKKQPLIPLGVFSAVPQAELQVHFFARAKKVQKNNSTLFYLLNERLEETNTSRRNQNPRTKGKKQNEKTKIFPKYLFKPPKTCYNKG